MPRDMPNKLPLVEQAARDHCFTDAGCLSVQRLERVRIKDVRQDDEEPTIASTVGRGGEESAHDVIMNASCLPRPIQISPYGSNRCGS